MSGEIKSAPPLANEITRVLRCPLCGNWLTNIRGGAICPKGHGHLYATVDAVTHARGSGEQIPNAVKLFLDQSPGEFADCQIYALYDEGSPRSSLFRRTTNATCKLSAAEGVLAATEDKAGNPVVREFVVDKKNTEKLMAIFTGEQADDE